MVSSFLQFCLEPLGGRLSRPVVIQAEHHVPQVLILLQHPVHNLEENLVRILHESNPEYKSAHIRDSDAQTIILHHLFFDFTSVA